MLERIWVNGIFTVYWHEYKQTTLKTNLALSFSVEHSFTQKVHSLVQHLEKLLTVGPRDINNNVYSNLVQNSEKNKNYKQSKQISTEEQTNHGMVHNIMSLCSLMKLMTLMNRSHTIE